MAGKYTSGRAYEIGREQATDVCERAARKNAVKHDLSTETSDWRTGGNIDSIARHSTCQRLMCVFSTRTTKSRTAAAAAAADDDRRRTSSPPRTSSEFTADVHRPF